MPAHRRRTRIAAFAVAMLSALPVGSAFAQESATPTPQTESAMPPPTESPLPTESPPDWSSPASSGDASDGEREAGDPLIGVPQTYRLRARVAVGGGRTGALPLPRAIRKVRVKSCRRTSNILGDHVPRRSTVRLTLFRRSGTPDSMRSKTPDTSCQRRNERRSAFRLRSRVGYPGSNGRVVRGPTSLRSAIRILTERANALADDVIEKGITPTLVLSLDSKRKSVRGMIIGLSRRYHLAVSKALSVARCESRFRPRARSAYYGGVYQQAFRYWRDRARRFGHPGASIFDPYANIDVSLRMARAYGWGHWGCA